MHVRAETYVGPFANAVEWPVAFLAAIFISICSLVTVGCILSEVKTKVQRFPKLSTPAQ